MTRVYYLTFSQRKEYGHSLAEPSTSNSLRAAVKALVQGFLQSCNQDVVWGYSIIRLKLERSASRLTCFFLCFVGFVFFFFARLISSCVVGLEASVFSVDWLEATCYSLSHRPLQHSSLLHQSQRARKRIESASRMEVIVLMT